MAGCKQQFLVLKAPLGLDLRLQGRWRDFNGIASFEDISAQKAGGSVPTLGEDLLMSTTNKKNYYRTHKLVYKLLF